MWPVSRWAREGTREDEGLLVFVGARHLECARVGRRGGEPNWAEARVWSAPVHLDAELATLRAALDAMAGAVGAEKGALREMRVVVHDAWLSAVSLPWSPSLAQRSQALLYARTSLGMAGQEVEASDTIRVDDAPYEQPRRVVAFQQALLHSLGEAAARLEVQLASVLPLTSAAWSFAREACGRSLAVAMIVDGETTLMLRAAQGSRARLGETSLRWLPAGKQSEASPRQEMVREWERLCLRDEVLRATERLPLIDLAKRTSVEHAHPKLLPLALSPVAEDVASAVSPALRLVALSGRKRCALDAIQTPTRSPYGIRIAAACAGAFAVAMTFGLVRDYGAVQAASRRLEASPAPHRAVARPVSWTRDELARVRSVNQAVKELNLPISRLLSALQAPSDIRAAVLSVETTQEGGQGVVQAAEPGGGASAPEHGSTVKIMAEARSSGDMTRYVAFLGAQQVLSGVYLTRHELVETDPQQPYRFIVEAQWKD